MSVTQVFTDTISKLQSIKLKDRVVVNPIRANNFPKTQSNVNDVFKYVNIWDEQIDEMIKGTNYSFNCESVVFVEFIPGESKMLLNGVTSYPEAKMTFHIFSELLDGNKDTMEQNLKIIELRDQVKTAVNLWSPTNCSKFMNNYDSIDYKHKNITKYLLTFNFNFTDYTGSIFDPNTGYKRRKVNSFTFTFMFKDCDPCSKTSSLDPTAINWLKDECKYRLTSKNLANLLKFNQPLLGVIDGINTNFVMPEDYITGEIKLNGQVLVNGDDYTIDINNNRNIAMLTVPEIGNKLTTTYIKSIQ